MSVRHIRQFLATNRKLWLPPVILTTILFAVLVAFGPGKQALMFVYKIF
jgi:hypothetical protein